MEEKPKLIAVGALFGQSWQIYKGRFLTLIKIILLPGAFILAGDLLAIGFGAVSTLFVIAGGLGLVLGVLALVSNLGTNVPPREAYRSALKKFWPYLWLSLLTGFTILGGLFMLIIPGLIFLIWFGFVLYIFVLDGEKGMNAMLKSKAYVNGYWWPIVGRGLLLILVVFLIALVFGSLGALVSLNEAWLQFTSDLVTLVIAPFSLIYFYLLYQNLKSLKPEVATQPAEGPRGFFIFSAIFGLVAALIVIVLIAAGFVFLWFFGEPTQ